MIKKYLNGLEVIKNLAFEAELAKYTGLPIIYHQVTLECDSECKTCKIWKMKVDPKTEMSTEKVKSLLDDGKTIEAKWYAIWGGEPLLRQDLPEIMKHAKKLDYMVNLCTNGGLLKERAKDICEHVDWIMVSIDGIGSDHDKIKGQEGLYDKAVQGLIEARKYQKKYGFEQLKIWTVVSKLNRDYIYELASLAESLEVKIQFFPMSVIYGFNDQYALTIEEQETVFSKIARFKKIGLPIINSNYHLNNLKKTKSYKCHYPKIALWVDSWGSIYSCENPLPSGGKIKVWGKVGEDKLGEIISREEFKQFGRKMEKCNLCQFPEMVDLSRMVGRSKFINLINKFNK